MNHKPKPEGEQIEFAKKYKTSEERKTENRKEQEERKKIYELME